MIQFSKEICGDLDQALRREWLETNGLGGFASSTIIGLNVRYMPILLLDWHSGQSIPYLIAVSIKDRRGNRKEIVGRGP